MGASVTVSLLGQTLQVLRMNTLSKLDDSQRKKMSDAYDAQIKEGNQKGIELCRSFKRIGYPKYHPQYMTSLKLKSDFDATSAWRSQLAGFCAI